jgi:hypothetical protein
VAILLVGGTASAAGEIKESAIEHRSVFHILSEKDLPRNAAVVPEPVWTSILAATALIFLTRKRSS